MEGEIDDRNTARQWRRRRAGRIRPPRVPMQPLTRLPVQQPQPRLEPYRRRTGGSMNLSISLRCNSCGNSMPKSTKISCDLELSPQHDDSCSQRFKLYLFCTICSAEMIIERNEQNTDYVVVFGATRFFQPEDEGSKISEERHSSFVVCDSEECSGFGDAMDGVHSESSSV
uniref:Putative coiled-coil protein n=1 Tax=Davidia involucrata TaxID=16924 RepID=A0A5B7BQ04_DAVIN